MNFKGHEKHIQARQKPGKRKAKTRRNAASPDWTLYDCVSCATLHELLAETRRHVERVETVQSASPQGHWSTDFVKGSGQHLAVDCADRLQHPQGNHCGGSHLQWFFCL